MIWVFQTKNSRSSLTKDEFYKGTVVLTGKYPPPRIISKVDPVYPEKAKEKGIRGNVGLTVRVDKSGHVEDVRLAFSIPLLDQAAIDAVKQWKFEPTIIKNKAVSVVFPVLVPFELK
jgi:protein TonB